MPLQQTLRHLQTAFANFFAKHAQYPNFRRKAGAQSAKYTASAFRWDDTSLTLAKMAVPLARPLVAQDAERREGDERYGVERPRRPIPRIPALRRRGLRKFASPGAAGIDFGLTDCVVRSTGGKIAAPSAFRKNEVRFARLQRRLARKQTGSANRRKARLKEKNRRLAKSISDAGWSEFVRQLTYKAKWYDYRLIGIDRGYPSSKRCAECGHPVASMPLKGRAWDCPGCGITHDRDIYAARNVLAAGLAVSAYGESVSPMSL